MLYFSSHLESDSAMTRNLSIAILGFFFLFQVPMVSAQSVYLAEANRNPFKRFMFINDKGETFRYTAFYKGASEPQGDLTVKFSVDTAKVDTFNAQHGTSYKMLPKESYRLGTNSATIARGSVSATPGEVSVMGKGLLKPSEEYLLPITVSVEGNLAKVDPALSTICYVITIVTAPEDFPHWEVYPDTPNGFFCPFNDKCLLILTSTGDLQRYGWNEASKKFDAPTTIQTGWSDIKAMTKGAGNTIQVFHNNGSIITYQLNNDASQEPLYRGTIFTAANTGVDNFKLIGNGNHRKMLLMQVNNGHLMHYGLNADWTEFIGPMTATPFDLRIYKILFFYHQDMIGITESGDMWFHQFSPSDFSFSASPTKISSGWKNFTHIIAFGTNLLARDANGKLRLYEFDRPR